MTGLTGLYFLYEGMTGGSEFNLIPVLPLFIFAILSYKKYNLVKDGVTFNLEDLTLTFANSEDSYKKVKLDYGRIVSIETSEVLVKGITYSSDDVMGRLISEIGKIQREFRASTGMNKFHKVTITLDDQSLYGIETYSGVAGMDVFFEEMRYKLSRKEG